MLIVVAVVHVVYWLVKRKWLGGTGGQAVGDHPWIAAADGVPVAFDTRSDEWECSS